MKMFEPGDLVCLDLGDLEYTDFMFSISAINGEAEGYADVCVYSTDILVYVKTYVWDGHPAPTESIFSIFMLGERLVVGVTNNFQEFITEEK